MKVLHSGSIMKCSHISQSTKRLRCFCFFLNRKVYFDLQLFTLQSSLKRKRKIGWKNCWCSLETQIVLFVWDERSKHRLPFLQPVTPKRAARPSEPETVRPTATLSPLPDWLNSPNAISLIHIILIVSSTNKSKIRVINFQCYVLSS